MCACRRCILPFNAFGILIINFRVWVPPFSLFVLILCGCLSSLLKNSNCCVWITFLVVKFSSTVFENIGLAMLRKAIHAQPEKNKRENRRVFGIVHTISL